MISNALGDNIFYNFVSQPVSHVFHLIAIGSQSRSGISDAHECFPGNSRAGIGRLAGSAPNALCGGWRTSLGVVADEHSTELAHFWHGDHPDSVSEPAAGGYGGNLVAAPLADVAEHTTPDGAGCAAGAGSAAGNSAGRPHHVAGPGDRERVSAGARSGRRLLPDHSALDRWQSADRGWRCNRQRSESGNAGCAAGGGDPEHRGVERPAGFCAARLESPADGPR